jgi:hypothetical protein
MWRRASSSALVPGRPSMMRTTRWRDRRTRRPGAWKKCTDLDCREDVFDEENEKVDCFIARVTPRRRPKKPPILSAE